MSNKKKKNDKNQEKIWITKKKTRLLYLQEKSSKNKEKIILKERERKEEIISFCYLNIESLNIKELNLIKKDWRKKKNDQFWMGEHPKWVVIAFTHCLYFLIFYPNV